MTETPNPHIIDTDTLTGEMRPIRRAVLALGSNLGERMASLQGAVNAIADTPDVWVTGVSPVYETEPVDCPPDAKTYLNAVVLIDTTLAASRLMDRALAIEDAFERERSEVENAPAHPRRRPDRRRRPAQRRGAAPAPAPAGRRAGLRAAAVARRRPRGRAPRPRPGRRPARAGRPERPQAARRPGPRDPVTPRGRARSARSARPRGDGGAGRARDGSGRRSAARALTGWAVVGLVGGWLLHPLAERVSRHRPDRHLGPAARAAAGRRDPRRARRTHLAHRARAPPAPRAAPGGEPAGARPGLRAGRRPGRRRLLRLRPELGRRRRRAGRPAAAWRSVVAGLAGVAIVSHGAAAGASVSRPYPTRTRPNLLYGFPISTTRHTAGGSSAARG